MALHDTSLCEREQDSPPRTGFRHGSYLTTHRKIRYFRITVPVHLQSLLGKKEIRRSLDGLDSRMARTKAIRLSVIAQMFFAFLDDMQQERIRLPHENSAQYAEKIRQISCSLDTAWFDAAVNENLSPAALALRLPSFLRDAGDDTTAVSEENGRHEDMSGSSVTQIDDRSAIAPQGAPPSPISPESEVRIRRKGIQATRQKEVIISNAKTLPSVNEAAESYIAAKKLTWSKASAKDIPPQIRQFVEIVSELEHGRELPVDRLSREHIRRYYDTVRHLPFRVNGQSAYRGKKWLEIAEMGHSGTVERLLSIKTMEVRQTNVRSFVNWCELEYRGAIQARYVNSGFPKVLSDKDIRRKGVKREAFSQDELRALLGDRQRFVRATEDVASRYWCPWIALYSGMRLEEICQLHLSDIREIDGVLCFSINEENIQSAFAKHVKSAAGIRNVPIHPWLWNETGLKDFLKLRWQSVPESAWATSMLFPDMQERILTMDLTTTKLGASVTKWFTRYRRSVGVGGQEGEASAKTFHSFRHTVIEYLHKQARVDLSMLQAVVGHELVDMGVTEGYAGEWPVSVLRDSVIAKINWHCFL